MTKMRLNEQIASLRRKNNLTQEGLAEKLGVTNQAVSKWESGQCFPDLTLLVELAELFSVSVDTLIGYQDEQKPAPSAVSAVSDPLPLIRNWLDSTADKGAFMDRALKMAYQLHAIIVSKEITDHKNINPGWDTDEVIEHAGNGEWGYTCINLEEITTVMRRGTAVFSNNRDISLTTPQMNTLCRIMQTFSDLNTLKVFFALYNLTISSEYCSGPVSVLAEKCALSTEDVTACLNTLSPYLFETTDEEGRTAYGIGGMWKQLAPLLTLFVNH